MEPSIYRRIGVAFIIFLIADLALPRPVDQKPDVRKIVGAMDELYRSRTSRGIMEMEIVTPNWQRTLKIQFWSQGLDKTFMRILEPAKERGIGTLRIGNEMWNYLPNTDKVMRIPPSMMMGSWMGSDYTNDDLVKEYTFIDDYDFAMAEAETPAPGVLYVKCVPHEGLPVVWGWIVLAVREADFLPLWEKFYDEKGRFLREITFREIKTFGNRAIPSVMELVPLAKEGQKTVVRYLDLEFDVPVAPEIFSLRNLRAGV